MDSTPIQLAVNIFSQGHFKLFTFKRGGENLIGLILNATHRCMHHHKILLFFKFVIYLFKKIYTAIQLTLSDAGGLTKLKKT